MKQSSPDEYIDRVRSSLNEDTVTLLADYALNKIDRSKFLLGANTSTAGWDAQDFVQHAILLVLEGKEGRRRWNENVDLLTHLKGIVDSSISHSINSKEAKTTMRESTVSHFKADLEETVYSLDCEKSGVPTPLDEAMMADIEKRMWDVMGYLSEDPLLKDIFECIYDGTTKTSEIAEILKTNTTEINNAKKRLDRRLKEYRSNITKEAVTHE